jgi:hypothetical protein
LSAVPSAFDSNIALPQEAIAMLRGHKIRQMEIRLALGQGGGTVDRL